jgi:hypothetical protein
MKLDDELRATFDVASEFIQPPPGLADNARQARRARRRRQLASVAACAIVLAAVGGAYAASGRHHGSAPAHPTAGAHVFVRVGYPVSQVAVSGRYLYLASDQSSLVAAYYRSTGKLERLITVPGSPDWLSVGPGGLVWVGAIDGGGQPGAVLLLRPDLTERSTDTSLDGGPVVPTSRQAALAPTQYGLLDVRMPAPGQPGRASQRLVPGTGLGPSLNTAAGAWAGMLGGRVVVQVTDGYGMHSHMVIAGQPRHTFGGATAYQTGAVTSTGRELWVEMFAVKDSNAASSGPLVRVDTQLRATTPAYIQHSAVLAHTEGVWSSGDTVWAATGARGHALVCFSSRSQVGPVITLQASGSIAGVAATASTVYVTTVQGDSTVTPAFGPSLVTSYPVPAACR